MFAGIAVLLIPAAFGVQLLFCFFPENGGYGGSQRQSYLPVYWPAWLHLQSVYGWKKQERAFTAGHLRPISMA